MNSEFNSNNQNDTGNSGENDSHQSGKLPGKNDNFIVSPIAAGFIGLIGGFFLYQIVGGILTVAIFGFDLESAPLDGIRLMTIAGQILFILLPALILARLFYEDVSRVIKLKIPSWIEVGLFTIGIIVLTPLLQSYLYIQNYFIELWAENSAFISSIKSTLDSLDQLVEKTYSNLLSANNVIEGLFVIIVIAIVPAICEETMFRGFVQKSFEFKMKPFWAIAVTALFFAVYHANPYGTIPLILLGSYFGFAAYASDSILIPIMLHFLNNFSAVMLYFIIGDDELISSNVVNPEELNTQILLFIGLAVLFIGVIILIRKNYQKLKSA